MADVDDKAGCIVWTDLTVPDAAAVRDFYATVVGWVPKAHPMGAYDDYVMQAPDTGATVAGVCHARGPNADLPAQWLVYVQVPDVDASAARCRAAGGEVVSGPRSMGDRRFCVVRDPAGAVLALLGPAASS